VPGQDETWTSFRPWARRPYADVVKPPRIAECPTRIECRAVNTIDTGDHTIFVGEVVAKSGDPDAMKDGTAFKDFLLHHT